MTLRQVLDDAAKALITSETPVLDAEILLAFVLGKQRSYLRAYSEEILAYSEARQFAECIKRRYNREPIAYITGIREFWSLALAVNEHTLVPRPDTELLVEATLKLMSDDSRQVKVADLGTGSGAIALALASERPKWQIHATDVAEKTLQVAIDNARRLGQDQIFFHLGDWCHALRQHDFDVIISNPPYIAETEWQDYVSDLKFEPKRALVSGLDGLDAIRTIVHSAKDYLKQNGHLLIEHGSMQGSFVREIFILAGFESVHSLQDLAHKERVTVGSLKG